LGKYAAMHHPGNNHSISSTHTHTHTPPSHKYYFIKNSANSIFFYQNLRVLAPDKKTGQILLKSPFNDEADKSANKSTATNPNTIKQAVNTTYLLL
jgi:hypothetical protein